MSDVISICNSALIKLGANSITTLGDGTKEANLCTIRFAECKKAVLRMHPWTSGTFRVFNNTPNVTAPVFGYANAFDLPADFVRVILVNPDTLDDYRIEAGQILGDFSELYLKYVRSVADHSDIAKYDELLCEALSCYIAWDLCYAITQSQTLMDRCAQDRDRAISKAKLANAQELPTIEVQADYFLQARLGPVESTIGFKTQQ